MKSYDKLAANKGYSEEMSQGRARSVAEGHGAGMPDFGIGHKTNNAMMKEWGDMSYSQDQHGDGSMDYESVKKAISAGDAKRLSRTKKKMTEY